MRNILIAGSDELLSIRFAAACLLFSQDHIFCISNHPDPTAQSIARSVIGEVHRLNDGVHIDSGLPNLQSRLHVVHPSSEEKELSLPDVIHQAWYFAPARHSQVQRRNSPGLQSFVDLLEMGQ